jgi:hypothetical protein
MRLVPDHVAKAVLITLFSFRSWNMPYGAWRSAPTRATDQFSPAGPAVSVSPPSDVVVTTPASAGAFSPAADSPSGLSKAIQQMNAIQRALLFVEGKHDELVKLMNKQQRMYVSIPDIAALSNTMESIMSTWLYQFWFFSFNTAKNWGRGPRDWTADLLELDKHLTIFTTSTPRGAGDSAEQNAREAPASLCRWGIHSPRMMYSPIPSPPVEEDTERDEHTDWPRSWRDNNSFPERLRDALESNSFSNMDANSLPVALPQVLCNAQKESDELCLEALGFSIMGRNRELLEEMCEKAEATSTKLDGLYPFHLATAYISGTDPCCNILDGLVSYPYLFNPRRLYMDDLGHTVLDNLMIAILKSHTSCMPGDVNDDLKRRRYFVGEEVDMCGRWDADSECIRALFAHGECRIPFEWKHKFCHTAAQVICHSIDILFSLEWSPDINTPSGLFVKRCTKADCGLKLQLFPLHTLVITAFQLIHRGCKGEDLFGMIACLLCLISNGANPLLTSEISLLALLEGQQNEKCDHESLSPLQLAERISDVFSINWSDEARTGWEVFCLVLCLARDACTPTKTREQAQLRVISPGNAFDEFIQYDDDPMNTDHNGGDIHHSDDNTLDFCPNCDSYSHFQGNLDLRKLWAAAQAELLTYRRLREGDPWTSPHFRLDEILGEYRAGHGIRIGLVDCGMLTSYCACGRFLNARDQRCACVDEVSAYYFCNIEEWTGSTFLVCPSRSWCDMEELEISELMEQQEERE